MMLCGISVVFNLLDDVFALVSCQRRSENRQVLMGFQSTEALGCFQHAGGRPTERGGPVTRAWFLKMIHNLSQREALAQCRDGL
jgi:hypothetical protein